MNSVDKYQHLLDERLRMVIRLKTHKMTDKERAETENAYNKIVAEMRRMTGG